MSVIIIDHRDAFEAEIAAVSHDNIERDRAAEDELRAAVEKWRYIARASESRRVFADYAEANFRRTGGR